MAKLTDRKNQLKIEYLSVNDLMPYEKNARKHDKKSVDVIKASIEQFGMNDPIGIWGDKNIIIEGHGRLMACKELKIDKVPCIRLDDLTDEQRRAYMLAHNKTTEISDWDFDLLSAELADIEDINMEDFGFDLVDIEEEREIVEDEVPEMDETKEPTAKLGDIWELGEHRLMCGDSTDKGNVELLMNGNKADMVITDPPYNVNYEGKTKDALKIENDNKSSEEFFRFLTSAFSCIEYALKEGGAFYVWFASWEHINFENALNGVGLIVREELVWIKNSLVLGRQDYQWRHEPCLYGWKDGASHNWYSNRSQTTVLEFNRPTANKEHPTMKPVELFAYQIKNSSKKNDIVLDIFGGSGTTIIACEQIGRKGYVMELDPRYCDVIIKRWETLTGKKAVKI